MPDAAHFSRGRATRIKIGIAVAYFLVHGFALCLCIWTADLVPWLRTLGWIDTAALVLPIVSLGFFLSVIACDRTSRLGGLASKAEHYRHLHNWEVADSAIARQSIHAVIGIGIIGGLMASLEVLRRSGPGTMVIIV